MFVKRQERFRIWECVAEKNKERVDHWPPKLHGCTPRNIAIVQPSYFCSFPGQITTLTLDHLLQCVPQPAPSLTTPNSQFPSALTKLKRAIKYNSLIVVVVFVVVAVVLGISLEWECCLSSIMAIEILVSFHQFWLRITKPIWLSFLRFNCLLLLYMFTLNHLSIS